MYDRNVKKKLRDKAQSRKKKGMPSGCQGITTYDRAAIQEKQTS